MSDITSLKQRLPTALHSAELIFANKDYTSAAILYFKAWFLVLDIILLPKEGRSPKDHAERFRMLERSFPVLYKELDAYYSTYRETYTTDIDEAACCEVRNYVQKLITAHQL